MTGRWSNSPRLLQRIAIVQVVPAAASQDEEFDAPASTRLAASLSPEDVQLYYQIALGGRRDLSMAPDPRIGFEMTLLRMLAFRPDSADTAASPAVAIGSRARRTDGGAGGEDCRRHRPRRPEALTGGRRRARADRRGGARFGTGA